MQYDTTRDGWNRLTDWAEGLQYHGDGRTASGSRQTARDYYDAEVARLKAKGTPARVEYDGWTGTVAVFADRDFVTAGDEDD